MRSPPELRVVALAQGGDGLARPTDGPVVFLEGVAPGDLVRAVLESPRGGHRRGRVVELLEAGPGRRTPPCPVADLCGGCGWQHLSEPAQEEAIGDLLRTALRRIGGFTEEEVEVPPSRAAGTPLGYRRRARFLVDFESAPPRLGFRRRRSHAVQAVPSCPVLEPELDELRAALAEVVGELARLLPGVRSAELSVDLPAPGRATAVLSVLDRASAPAREAVADTLLAASGALRSVEVRSPQGTSRRGPERIAYRQGPDEAPQRFPARHAPGGFLQASLEGNRLLVERALLACGPVLGADARVLELFSGSGNLTLPLAATGAKLTAVEEETAAVAACREALDEAGLRAELVVGEAAAVLDGFVRDGRRFDLVLLDPPRSGAKDCVRLLPALGPERIVSLSCDAATFARDAALLRDAGYRLVRAEPLLLFPQTPHFEVVGTLVKD